MEFKAFPKIARLSRECIITEKIDGTNACIYNGEGTDEFLCGSRSRWITPGDDNFGFARWAHEHREELILLGPGLHFGEWWGAGIQRRYNMTEKKWSIFNTLRWTKDPEEKSKILLPECVDIVPVLYRGVFDTSVVDNTLDYLRNNGSLASPGFNRPEGIVIYHVAGNVAFKKTIEKDAEPKSRSNL